MRDRLRERYHAALTRIRRFERRESYEIRRWLENTRNLVHLSIVIFVPLLIALVTWLSNAVGILPYLLFPPLASGTYTLFAEPESEYASPSRFIGGLTIGALCGWFSYELLTGSTQSGGFTVSPTAAAVSIFLTGLVTWLLNVEEASAYSSALLVHIIDVGNVADISVVLVSGVTVTVTPQLTYVASVFVSSTLVAGAFVVWYRQFYEQRAQYLYESTKGDDHVLVPMRTESADQTAMLGARLAAAHDAGKVVLLDIVDSEAVAAAQRELLSRDAARLSPNVGADGGSPNSEETVSEGATDSEPRSPGLSPADLMDKIAADRAVAAAATRLEERAAEIETQVGVPCEVVVAVDTGNTASLVLETARQANCDLIATPYEEQYGSLSPFVRSLFRGNVDVLVHRSQSGRTRWRRVMVPVRRAGDVAHAMIDFAIRLTGQTGQVSVCNCVEQGRKMRRAQEMLSDLVDPFDGPLETLVSPDPIAEFLDHHAAEYDLVFMGASMDRSAASRLISPPTFERIQDLDCDVAIVDRKFRQ
ncbi:HPP family protein [Halorientalis brevis]|uniref:HPP family protein n=1 Tax=Halorientalis brevis TaxID=1126241 RepID=A0ABD6C7Z7_9EURY|nr:HPP family protein [Halorientalis brevis]